MNNLSVRITGMTKDISAFFIHAHVHTFKNNHQNHYFFLYIKERSSTIPNLYFTGRRHKQHIGSDTNTQRHNALPALLSLPVFLIDTCTQAKQKQHTLCRTHAHTHPCMKNYPKIVECVWVQCNHWSRKSNVSTVTGSFRC